MVNVDELKALYEMAPFRPFEILLNDGRRVVIDRPELVAWSTDAHMLAFPFSPDAIDWVDFAQVTAIRSITGPLFPRRREPG